MAGEEHCALTSSPDMKEDQAVEGSGAPPKKSDILSSGVEQESTAIEEQEIEGDEFP